MDVCAREGTTRYPKVASSSICLSVSLSLCLSVSLSLCLSLTRENQKQDDDGDGTPIEIEVCCEPASEPSSEPASVTVRPDKNLRFETELSSEDPSSPGELFSGSDWDSSGADWDLCPTSPLAGGPES